MKERQPRWIPEQGGVEGSEAGKQRHPEGCPYVPKLPNINRKRSVFAALSHLLGKSPGLTFQVTAPNITLGTPFAIKSFVSIEVFILR